MILYEQIKKMKYTADSPSEGYEKVCTQDILRKNMQGDIQADLGRLLKQDR